MTFIVSVRLEERSKEDKEGKVKKILRKSQPTL